MIAKVEVRRYLVSYENKIREEAKGIREKIQAMEDACSTFEMERIWRNSNEYTELHTRLITLNKVLSDIIDMRYDRIFEEAE
jgi:NurA-like 5'-3' nuclease